MATVAAKNTKIARNSTKEIVKVPVAKRKVGNRASANGPSLEVKAPKAAPVAKPAVVTVPEVTTFKPVKGEPAMYGDKEVTVLAVRPLTIGTKDAAGRNRSKKVKASELSAVPAKAKSFKTGKTDAEMVAAKAKPAAKVPTKEAVEKVAAIGAKVRAAADKVVNYTNIGGVVIDKGDVVMVPKGKRMVKASFVSAKGKMAHVSLSSNNEVLTVAIADIRTIEAAKPVIIKPKLGALIKVLGDYATANRVQLDATNSTLARKDMEANRATVKAWFETMGMADAIDWSL